MAGADRRSGVRRGVLLIRRAAQERDTREGVLALLAYNRSRKAAMAASGRGWTRADVSVIVNDKGGLN